VKHLELGDGPERILWLHGGNVAGWMWGEQLPAFADYRSIVPDFPGFGASNDERWESIASTADGIAALLEGTPAHVVGLSLGSSVALELAARHPGLVSSLFLASAQLTAPLRRDMLAARVLLAFWNQRGFWTTLARSYGLAGGDAELFVSTGLGIRKETAEAIYAEVSRGVAGATLAAIDTPAILVAGEKDSSAITRGSLQRGRAEIRGAITAVAPGMHHQWNIENVEMFNQSLRTWLTSREAASSLGTRI